jgi:putative phage-type endonuclease
MNIDDPGYAAWVAGRKEYIGASEVAAVLGISPWDSPHDVWGTKLGHWPAKEVTIPMLLGHWLEEFIARRWVGREHEMKWDLPAETVALEGYPHIRATPDRTILNIETENREVGLIECKKVSWRLAHHWDGAPPIYVQAQCQVQMACCPWAERTDVVALFDDEIRQYTVERDQKTIDTIVEQVDAWWQRHILGGHKPPVDSGPPDKVAAALARTHTPECVNAVFVPYEIEEAVFELGRLKAIAKDLDEDITKAENRVKDALGDKATDAMRPGSEKPIATWRPQEDTRVDTKRLAAEYPDVAKAVMKTTTRNVLRVYPERCN